MQFLKDWADWIVPIISGLIGAVLSGAIFVTRYDQRVEAVESKVGDIDRVRDEFLNAIGSCIDERRCGQQREDCKSHFIAIESLIKDVDKAGEKRISELNRMSFDRHNIILNIITKNGDR